MTGQYSIRNGLSLILVPGSPNTLSARAFTMGELFKSVGYATAIFGKWQNAAGINYNSLQAMQAMKRLKELESLSHPSN